MTYIDHLNQRQVEATLIAKGDALKARWDTDDARFALWLQMCAQIMRRTIGLDLDDIEDYTWRDAFDDGSAPRAAVTSALDYAGIGV